MSARSFMALLFAFFITLVFCTDSSAGGPIEEIRRITEQVISIISDPEFQGPEKIEEKAKRIRNSVDERFDRIEMARRTLARHWKDRSDAEREEFSHLFERFLEKTYLDRVIGYSGEEILYDREEVDGKYASVFIRIVLKDSKEVPVIYKLKKKEELWYVYDISIEGVSLINNYRTQFNSIITRKSYKRLVEMLKEKIEEG